MLVTNKENLMKAAKSGYAIPALNTQGGNYDIIWAACRAAEKSASGARARFLFRYPFIWTMAGILISAWRH